MIFKDVFLKRAKIYFLISLIKFLYQTKVQIIFAVIFLIQEIYISYFDQFFFKDCLVSKFILIN